MKKILVPFILILVVIIIAVVVIFYYYLGAPTKIPALNKSYSGVSTDISFKYPSQFNLFEKPANSYKLNTKYNRILFIDKNLDTGRFYLDVYPATSTPVAIGNFEGLKEGFGFKDEKTELIFIKNKPVIFIEYKDTLMSSSLVDNRNKYVTVVNFIFKTSANNLLVFSIHYDPNHNQDPRFRKAAELNKYYQQTIRKIIETFN